MNDECTADFEWLYHLCEHADETFEGSEAVPRLERIEAALDAANERARVAEAERDWLANHYDFGSGGFSEVVTIAERDRRLAAARAAVRSEGSDTDAVQAGFLGSRSGR